MRNVTIAYTVVAIWAFGWLAGRFGLLPSLFASVILLTPTFLAWRMISREQEIKRREFAFLGVVAMLAVAASSFIVTKWYDTELDRHAMFDREYHAFKRRVSEMPEYKNVDISYTHRKGGRVYLKGSVINKDSHDRLIQTIDWMIRNNDSGYYDGVEYPGKAAGPTAESPKVDNEEIVINESPREKKRRLVRFDQYYLRGLANTKLKKWNHAIAAFNSALELCPESVHALDGLVECYRMTQDDEKLEAVVGLRDKFPKPTEPYEPQFLER